MSAGFKQVERLFEQARALPPAARTDFLSRCEGSDRERREVRALLAADEASGDFLTVSALDRMAQSVATDGWTLQRGERVGAYTIVSLLGSGGMGEVWQARDERLDRDVAIKFLLPHFATNPDRLRRFADEARAASALNHPNILTVHDIGQHHGTPYLVAERLTGQTLRDRLAAGPVSMADAVGIARAVAGGLTAAHASGIVHRDLKPENVFLRSDRGVKILDFGLAKLQTRGVAVAAQADTSSAVIVGTAGYIAPEQLRNEPVDARADLFALGVMLYEMLTGRHPFRGASTLDTVHAVLTEPPPDLPPDDQIPESLARIVSRLLEKDPGARFQSALDTEWALQQVEAAARHAPRLDSRNGRHRRWRAGLPIAVAAALLAGGVLTVPSLMRTRTAPTRTELTAVLPPGMALASAPMVSPAGDRIAFVGRTDADARLFVRTMTSRALVAVPGSVGATDPFWSADGASLAFFMGGRLTKVTWPGGAPVPLTAAPFPSGASWSRSGAIFFAPDVILTGIARVSAEGDPSRPLTQVDSAAGDTSHSWPVAMPDGVHFLYHVRSTRDDRAGIHVGGTDGPAAGRRLFQSQSNVVHVPLPGTSDSLLLSVVDGRIEARHFDAAKLTVAAKATSLGLSAAGPTLWNPAMLSATPDVLVFTESPVPSGERLEAVDRNGTRVRLWEPAEALNWPRLSPDGTRIALQRVDAVTNNPDIWVEDLDRRIWTRVTTTPVPDIQPVWSPDGLRLAYTSGHLPGRAGAVRTLNIAAADGTGVVRSLPCPAAYCEATDWRGDHLLLNVRDDHGWDVWTVSLRDGVFQRVLAGTFNERDARFSVDGTWIAYVSDEAGRAEVSVRSVSGSPKRVVVSGDGGDQPVWGRSGRELFYVDPQGGLRSVAVSAAGSQHIQFGAAEQMKVPPVGFGHWGTQYDVSADGRRIYALRANQDPGPREIQVVFDWRARID